MTNAAGGNIPCPNSNECEPHLHIYMITFLHSNWPVITVAAAWLARERLNILALGAWLDAHGGIGKIVCRLFWNDGTFNIQHSTLNAEEPAPAAGKEQEKQL